MSQDPAAQDTAAQDQLAALVGELTQRAEDDPAARAALAALVEAIPPPDSAPTEEKPIPSFAATLWEEWERQQEANNFTGFNNI
jgi:hypothetical protein